MVGEGLGVGTIVGVGLGTGGGLMIGQCAAPMNSVAARRIRMSVARSMPLLTDLNRSDAALSP
jgi:hypothetical protein